MTAELALYEVADGVATVTLNRPESHNGWTEELQEAFFDQLDRAAEDPEARVIVVTGAGRSFCPGGDLQALDDHTGSGLATVGVRPMTHVMSMPKPTIAAINGNCAGFGMALAAMCDLRFSVRSAKFTTSFVRRGVAAEHTITYLLPRQLGLQVALDLLVTGRVFLGDEAKELGFVLEVVDDEVLGHAQAYAREMAAACSPLAMAVIRRQVYEDLDQGHEAARLRSLELMERISTYPDFAEGMASFAERRPPRFAPLPLDIEL